MIANINVFFHSRQENIIRKEQINIIPKSDKFWRLQHIKIRKAQAYRNTYRYQIKQQKQHTIRHNHEVGRLILFDLGK